MKKLLIYILAWYIVTMILHFLIFKITQEKLVYDAFEFCFGLIISIPCSFFGGLWTYYYDRKIKEKQDQAIKFRMGGAVYFSGLPGHESEKEFCEFYSKWTGENIDKFGQIKEQLTGLELFEYC